eukprot:IDg2428t1
MRGRPIYPPNWRLFRSNVDPALLRRSSTTGASHRRRPAEASSALTSCLENAVPLLAPRSNNVTPHFSALKQQRSHPLPFLYSIFRPLRRENGINVFLALLGLLVLLERNRAALDMKTGQLSKKFYDCGCRAS